jgi:hypothetical protein
MASFLGPIGQLIYSTASTLIDNQVTTRLSSTVNELVTTGFKVVEEVLKVAQDLTAPEPAQPSQPQQGEQP